MVELAIALPLLMVLVAGVIDYGLGVQAINNVSSAARTGARMGARQSTQLTASCGGNFSGSCGGAGASTITATTSVVDAAVIETCRYLSSYNMHTGTDYNITVDVVDPGVAGFNNGTISNPSTQRISVEVQKNSPGGGAFCLICVDQWAPGISAEAIRGKSNFILDGQCA